MNPFLAVQWSGSCSLLWLYIVRGIFQPVVSAYIPAIPEFLLQSKGGVILLLPPQLMSHRPPLYNDLLIVLMIP